MKVTKDRLTELIRNKLMQAGLSKEHADQVADVLVYADLRGAHSHGAIRVEYYCERLDRGGINKSPQFRFEKTGPATGIFHGDNGPGQLAAKLAMDEAIKMAKASGIAAVGVRSISHSGALGYFVQQAAHEDLIGISVCQADPMVVPHGGSKPYYGTNPIAFAARGMNGDMVTFDMSTSVKPWGKILEARVKNEPIPDTWAVGEHGKPTTDPFRVRGLLPLAGPKGFGLAMMVDILSGMLLGLPFGKHVTELYGDMTQGRDLGQLHVVINPAYFTHTDIFKACISQMMRELNEMEPAEGFDQVYYPGQQSRMRAEISEREGIVIADEIYRYLVSDDLHYNRYHMYDPLAD
jgi:ureidoglycolate dehydrogenase (NAD+)